MRYRLMLKTVLLAAPLVLLADGASGQENGAPLPRMRLDSLWQEPVSGTRMRASSYERSGANGDYVTVKPRERKVLLDHKGRAGRIVRIWLTLRTENPDYLKTTRLRFVFDGRTTAVDVPVGMLFATGPWRVNDLCSPVLNVMRARPMNKDSNGTGRGSFNFGWPMPFTESARVEVVNDADAALHQHFHIDYHLGEVGPEPLLFHARHHVQAPTRPSGRGAPEEAREWNHTLADIKCQQGRYVGTVLAVESLPDRAGKWYEGDDLFFVDGQVWPPSVHGTGTEDYFGMAWGIHRPFQGHDHGVTHYERNLTDHDRFFDGRFVLYRWHLQDPIAFHESLHASLEAGHRNDCEQHYESVAFWYGRDSDP